jgi:protein-L-isoaspartate(D-aspartate) O-methyltransferase
MLEEKKKALIDYLVKNDTLKTEAIINAFREVSREDFVLQKYREYAYSDEPLPIGSGQTISQPTTVAIMTESLEPKQGQKILEIGTGSGYQAAILSKVVGSEGKIITIEIIPSLVEFAKHNLKEYDNVEIMLADGSKGWPKEKPYDGIIVTAGAPKIPDPLFEQLKEGGVMVIPVSRGIFAERMLIVKKIKGKMEIKDLGFFTFVPLIGEHGVK